MRTVAWGGEAVQAPPTAQCFVITVLTWTQRLGWPLTDRNSCGSCGEQEMSEVVKGDAGVPHALSNLTYIHSGVLLGH